MLNLAIWPCKMLCHDLIRGSCSYPSKSPFSRNCRARHPCHVISHAVQGLRVYVVWLDLTNLIRHGLIVNLAVFFAFLAIQAVLGGGLYAPNT